MRVQGFRRALPRRVPRTPVRGFPAAAHRARGDVGRHRRRRRRGVSSATWADVVLLYPKNLGVGTPGAAAVVLGRQRAGRSPSPGTFDDCQRDGEGRVPRSELSTCGTTSSAEQHQHRPAAPQAVYYAQASLAIFRGEGRRPNFIVPSGNLGNAAACVLAARHGPADRRHRARHQREPDYRRLPRARRMAATAERRDARLRDGRRRSLEHGAAARVVGDARAFATA